MNAPVWLLLRGLTRDQRHWGDVPERLARALPPAWTSCPVRMSRLPTVAARARSVPYWPCARATGS